MDDKDIEYLSSMDVRKIYGIGRTTLWNILKNREIEYFKTKGKSGKIFIKKSEMERWVKERTMKVKVKKNDNEKS